jgi:4,5-DOPA dioxygenase extradiol
MGTASQLAAPSAEHFLPLLYISGLQNINENIMFFNEKVTLVAISMLPFQVVLLNWLI